MTTRSHWSEMHVHLLRHGRDAAAGTEVPAVRQLTSEGCEQAARAAARLRSLGVTELWSSTLERARQTADIVGRALALDVRADGRLNEIEAPAGVECAAPRERRPGTTPAGAESWEDLLERVASLLGELCRAPDPGRRVLLVTHSGIFDAVHELLAFGGGRPVELAVGHTGLTHWQYRPTSAAGRWLLHSHNDTSHLTSDRPGSAGPGGGNKL